MIVSPAGSCPASSVGVELAPDRRRVTGPSSAATKPVRTGEALVAGPIWHRSSPSPRNSSAFGAPVQPA